jgi:uncharacterized membrane protein
MNGFLARPGNALWAGVIIAALGLGYWLTQSYGDRLGLVSFLARLVHIGAAMLWIGMVWFVNFIQLVALRETDDSGRKVLMQHIVPRVALLFRMASHVVVASGGVLLLTTGYLLDRWVFPSSVYIPSARGLMLWAGVIAALIMWGLVHRIIWPNLKIILDGGASPSSLAQSRERILFASRINLMLAVPVTSAMVAAAHLY